MSKCNKHRYVSTSPKVCVVCLLSQLTEANATIAEHIGLLRDMTDAGMIPTSSVADGGAAKYSRHVVLADKARALLEKNDE